MPALLHAAIRGSGKRIPQTPVYVDVAVDKLRIGDYRQFPMQDFGSNDVIGEFQHFEIVVTPRFLPDLRTRFQRDVSWLHFMVERLIEKVRKPVLSITMVVYWASQAEFEHHKLSEAKEREQKTKIQEEIATVGKWGHTTIGNGPLRGTLVSTRVYPFRNTEVFLEHIYPEEDTDGSKDKLEDSVMDGD
jgi:hypothetical protein